MYEIFKDMTDGVCIFDLKGFLKYMNASAKAILGFADGADLVGKRIVEMIPIIETNDKFIQVFLDFIVNMTAAEDLIALENEDGSLRHVRVSVTRLEENKVTGEAAIIMLLTDYTELLKVRSVLERYTSKDIARAALEEPDGDKQGGKLVDATVLFSDIRGFTALSGEVAPTTLLSVVNNYFSVMDSIINKYNGTVMEFLGDGILAAFGVPTQNEQHAYRAVACALEMQNAMSGVNEWNKARGVPPFEIGIAVNSGPMVAGNIGSQNTMKYQCIGQEVNLAGRIESYSVGGQVLISESTLARIDAEVTIKGSRKILPKGSANEIEIFDVCGVSGEYSTAIESEQEQFSVLKTPVPISFCLLDGKAVGSDYFSAQILKISDKSAWINTDHNLHVLDNIMIRYNGEICAKVVDKTEQGILIRFTSISISDQEI